MLKENIKTVISINIDNDKLVFSCLEISKSFDTVLKGYYKIKNSSDIFNNITKAVIKASNGKKAKSPIEKVDEIIITNRMLTMTLARTNKIKSKKTDIFYKPKHLKGVLKGLNVSDLETGIDFDKIGEDLCSKKGFIRPLVRSHPSETETRFLPGYSVNYGSNCEPRWNIAQLERMNKRLLNVIPDNTLNDLMKIDAESLSYSTLKSDIDAYLKNNNITNIDTNTCLKVIEAKKSEATIDVIKELRDSVDDKDIKTCDGLKDIEPFYNYVSPARRVMFQNAMNEIDSMLSMALDTSKTKLSDVERMADIVYPCITKAVKESRMNKQGNDYYVVFCTGTDTVESFSVNDNELERKLSVLKETQQHKFLDLSNLSRIPIVKEQCKELTTELLNFVLDKLPSDIVNKVVRIVFNISFLDKYRDEYIKTNNKQLFFGIDHVFRKPGFDTESYINFKQCDLSNFMLETNSGILKLKVKGEI